MWSAGKSRTLAALSGSWPSSWTTTGAAADVVVYGRGA